ncbi:MAG: insulinase family protein [Gemmatimonadota bacterium]|nr:insulinase family protein [Gemmatimonadota bacterium]
MKIITLRSLIGLVLVVISAGAAQGQFPTEPPAPMPLTKLGFPPFREARLRNGLDVILVENRRLPVVSIQFSIPTGSVHDPAGKRGVAEMVSDLLTKGTATRTAEQIAAAIEGVGGSLNASAGTDFFTISATVLADGADLAFALIGDVLRNATMPDEEIELTRRRILSALDVERSDPAAIADRYFSRTLYGDHPYGTRETPTSVRAITADDVRSYAATFLRPEGSLLVVAGDLGLNDVRRLADRYLGEWRGRVPARTYGEPPLPRPTEIVLVHRPGSEQSNIVVGNLGLRPGAADYYAATVANRVLGAGTDARLFLILREQKSWTYGAYSSLSRRYDIGPFQATAEVRTTVTDSALAEMLHQLRRIGTELVPDSELGAAKGYLTGVFPLTIETAQQVAGQVAVQKRLGLGDDYLEKYRDRIAGITAAQALAAARTLIRPDSAVIVVVGDGGKVHEGLAAIAPVRIIDVEGNTLTVDDLAPPAGVLALDPAQLTPRRDSLRVMIQGNPMGAQILEYTVEEDAIVAVERTMIPLMGMNQETRVVMDGATLALRALDQTGQVGPQSAETHLAVADGRITGRAQTPQPGGQPKVAEIDTILPEGAIESSQLTSIIPALALADGATFTVSVFNSSEGTFKPYAIRVDGTESVSVPAGTFDVFKVVVSGGAFPTAMYVTRETPRRIVRIEIVGQPFVLELAR